LPIGIANWSKARVGAWYSRVVAAAEPTRPPFSAGASPFHCKGVAYRNLLAYVDDTIDGKRDQFIRALPDADLRAFIAQPLLVGSWYDALPMVTLCHEAGRQLRLPPLRFAREMSRASVQRDMRGIYKVLLHFSSPEGVLQRMSRTTQQYFDFVKREITQQGATQYRLTDTGVPAWAAPYYMSIGEGFIDQLLPMTGAREVRQHWDRPEPAGETHGVPVVAVTRYILWS